MAQERDRANNLSGIHLSALDEGLKKIYLAAKRRKGECREEKTSHREVSGGSLSLLSNIRWFGSQAWMPGCFSESRKVKKRADDASNEFWFRLRRNAAKCRSLSKIRLQQSRM